MIWYILYTAFWSLLWFLASVIVSRNDIADTAWGLFPIFLGIGIYFTTEDISFVWIVSFIAVCIWGGRLALYIGKRTVAKKEEDPRYKQWRETWKYFYVRSFLQVFLLQSLLALILALPLIFSVHQTEFGVLNCFGIVLFCFGFLFEVISDAQLARFIAQKKEGKTHAKIMKTGLWKYTRHPNYFGEVVLWWGIFCISFDVSYWYVTIFSPLLITLLILKVSGIPMAESRYAGDEEWESYASKTSVFIPLPPRT